MPSREELVQPFLAKVRSKADAGSVASGVIAPWRTISGSRLFGTLPSSLKMKVSVPSGALYCPGRPYAAARATVKVAAGELRLRGCDFGAARWSRPSDQLGLMSLRGLRAFLACLSTLLAKAHALCELGARLGVVRGDHRVVGRQPPMLPVLLRSHVVAGAQVALQGLVLLAVEQRDQVIAGDRLLDRDGRLPPRRLCRGRGADGPQGRMDFADQRRKLDRRNGVVAHVGGDDLRGEFDEIAVVGRV